ncbi:MAG: GLPGLI family protein [Bergeyella zoohelcum]|nr:GLPGLI family protein [Bergeyella zoohelcum]
MIKRLSLVLMAVSGMAYAQSSRFIYEVSMKIDSTAQPVVETAYLDVTKDKSVFYGEKRVQRDSLMEKSFQTRTFNPSQMDQLRSKINYKIEKQVSEQKVVQKDRIGRDTYAYTEDRPLDWKIMPETSTIGDYKVQKAETDFAGRHWVAWFTQDVPVMDGPYKFYGLPGLIVKVEDSKGDYSFDLKETKNLNSFPNLSERGNIISVKRKDYNKQLERYKKDPVSYMTQSRANMPSPPGGGGNAPRQLDPEREKEMQPRMLEEIRTNNNPIELN